jgi:hypothetical protein
MAASRKLSGKHRSEEAALFRRTSDEHTLHVVSHFSTRTSSPTRMTPRPFGKQFTPKHPFAFAFPSNATLFLRLRSTLRSDGSTSPVS